jgi:hypothetical protein
MWCVTYWIHESLHKWWQQFFGQKCGNMWNGGYTFENTWHILVDVTIRGGMCTGVHTHFAFRRVGILIWKCKSVKWNIVHRWKQQFSAAEMHESAKQSYVKHWVVAPFRIRQLQLGYRHSKVEVCQLLIFLAVTILYQFTQTCCWP